MVKRLEDLRFTQDEEGQLKDLRVRYTPHYAHAVAFYFGGDCREYEDWQKSRGKPVGTKVKKYNKLLQSLQKKGVRKAIQISGNRIVHGHHRAAAMAALGYEEIECQSL